MSRQIYHLRITVEDVRPVVWRRIAVPGAYTLDRLHRVIQLSVGWQNCHLHSFEIDGTQYGEPDPDELMADEPMSGRDEIDVRLDAVATKDSEFAYVYDFGDWWEHTVTVEEVLPAESDERYPYCAGGAGVCPPEDIGGVSGYQHYLEAAADEAHPDHDQMIEWYGQPAAKFSADRVSAVMRQMA